MTCNTRPISLVSRLIWKHFRWKLTDIFENVCSLHTCFSADSFHLLSCITPCESSGRFFRATQYKKCKEPVKMSSHKNVGFCHFRTNVCVCHTCKSEFIRCVFINFQVYSHFGTLGQLYSVHMFFVFVNFSVYGFVLYLLDNCDSAVVQNSLNYVLSNWQSQSVSQRKLTDIADIFYWLCVLAGCSNQLWESTYIPDVFYKITLHVLWLCDCHLKWVILSFILKIYTMAIFYSLTFPRFSTSRYTVY